ncbi:hypothetical protein LCL96_12495 [Rossellomorea aquimaris]|uniref:hypothetical protein n=1 Tax=Rossellomorea aquimaris TaxID=189382 RepID=UPI001CD4B1EB|nr:hypothetical protein [Rossellomorea aquimaris]MCA1059767.1 hypothetical protein [Rossellomorea aquimaris]
MNFSQREDVKVPREEYMKKLKLKALEENNMAHHGFDGEVLHESEFLRFVTQQLIENMDVDSYFLSTATGVNSDVFDLLLEKEDISGIISIITATVGVQTIVKMALDYYGIAYFTTVDQAVDSVVDLGNGFYQFVVC